jgi:hypothetical protein
MSSGGNGSVLFKRNLFRRNYMSFGRNIYASACGSGNIKTARCGTERHFDLPADGVASLRDFAACRRSPAAAPYDELQCHILKADAVRRPMWITPCKRSAARGRRRLLTPLQPRKVELLRSRDAMHRVSTPGLRCACTGLFISDTFGVLRRQFLRFRRNS